MESLYTRRYTPPQKYHGKRRNAVAYNPDKTCIKDKNNLIAHIMAEKTPKHTMTSKVFCKQFKTKLILRNV